VRAGSASKPAEGEGATGQSRSPRRAAWLSEEVLVLACPPDGETFSRHGNGGGLKKRPRRSARIEAKAFVAPLGRIFATVPGRSLERAPRLDLVDAETGERLTVEASQVTGALTDLRTFLREGPAGWDAATRTALLSFHAALGAEQGLSGSLGDGLRQTREVLRERQPLTIEDRRVGRGVTVERLHRIDERAFYVRGRAWDVAAPIASLAATSPEGERVELLQRLFRRPDLDDRFFGLFEIATASDCAEGWVVEAASGPGRAVEVSASLTPDALNTILVDAGLDFDGADALREQQIRPAVARLAELLSARVEIVELASHGSAPPSPAISLVVPLQRRVDLIEHQLAQFAADPELERCELLYVLDDPEQRDLLEELAGELFRLYGIPFRVAVLTETAGRAIACELGASLARADRLAFLDADVLPDKPGWLGALAAALDADPGAGAVAPKLLYADEAIDQAGLGYARAEEGDEWRVEHRLRGMHRGVPAAAEAGRVPAVGAACLMIDAAVFAEIGGFQAEYRVGEYEGSDLSHRLADRGRHPLYVPEAELYRLEGLGAAPEVIGERYARWLHHRLWGRVITGVWG
jgi:GT2 family glycosyltransferase